MSDEAQLFLTILILGWLIVPCSLVGFLALRKCLRVLSYQRKANSDLRRQFVLAKAFMFLTPVLLSGSFVVGMLKWSPGVSGVLFTFGIVTIGWAIGYIYLAWSTWLAGLPPLPRR